MLVTFAVPDGIDVALQTGLGEYRATINWGDGEVDTNVIPFVTSTDVTVVGRHTYHNPSDYVKWNFFPSVTLQDDSGGVFVAPLQDDNGIFIAPLVVTVDPDVTTHVRAIGSGLIFNPATRHFVGDLNVTSTFGLEIPGPFYVVIDDLPAGVTLANAPALTADGDPIFTIDVPVLSLGASLPTIPLEFSNPGLVPISYRVRVIDGPGGAAGAAATSDRIVVTNKPIVAVEGSEFSGVVASFVVPLNQPQQGFSATVDWGDGAVTPGTIVALGQGLFEVVGTHTYQRLGRYRVPIVVRDSSGAEFAAEATPADASILGSVTYLVTLDTATLKGDTGFLSFQFNAGALPGSPAATAHVTQFVALDATLLGATTDGVASGDLTTEVSIGAGGVLNRFTQGIQFGDRIQFELTIDGAGITAPALGLFGDVFAVQLLAADGVTPLLSADASAAALKIDLGPDGTTRSRAFPPDTAGSPSFARAVAFDGAAVGNAAMDALQVPVDGVEGNEFSAVVATFTSANPFEVATDFTAVVELGRRHTGFGGHHRGRSGRWPVRGHGNASLPGAGQLYLVRHGHRPRRSERSGGRYGASPGRSGRTENTYWWSGNQ